MNFSPICKKQVVRYNFTDSTIFLVYGNPKLILLYSIINNINWCKFIAVEKTDWIF